MSAPSGTDFSMTSMKRRTLSAADGLFRYRDGRFEPFGPAEELGDRVPPASSVAPEALDLASRVYVLRNGHVALEGAAGDLAAAAESVAKRAGQLEELTRRFKT